MIYYRALGVFMLILFVFVSTLQSRSLDTMPFWPVDQYSAKSPDQDFLEKYRSDNAFDYGVVNTDQKPNFRKWLRNKIRELFLSASRSTRSIIRRIILYGLLIFMIIAISLHLTRTRIDPLLGKEDHRILSRQLLNREVEPGAWREQLDSYLKNEEWDYAIRAVYLLALRSLGNAGMIKRSSAKTNRAYLNEIRYSGIRGPFREIINLFEYDWYGGFQVVEEDVKQSIAALDSLESALTEASKMASFE